MADRVYKILIADDEEIVLEAIKRRLEREGYQSILATDGQEALLKIEIEQPDIAILDIIMPKLNGFEVLKNIRAKNIKKWLPVIILSAKDEFDSIKKGYSLEADYYITKPFSMGQLIKGIETMISIMPLKNK